MYSFSYLEPVCCSMSSSNCCFLTCIQISQEVGQVVWYSHLFQNSPQFIVIHTVKGFGIVNKAEIDVFLELSCFFNDSADVGNLISGSSAFSKTSLNIWKFTVDVLLKPGLENFEHYFWKEKVTLNLSRNMLCCYLVKFSNIRNRFREKANGNHEWVLVAQLCSTLCSLVDCSPPGSSVPGILQARTPEWVAISFSRFQLWVFLKYFQKLPRSPGLKNLYGGRLCYWKKL